MEIDPVWWNWDGASNNLPGETDVKLTRLVKQRWNINLLLKQMDN